MTTNVEIVNRAYQAFASGDIPAVIDLLTDDVSWNSPKTLPQGGDYTGRDGAMQFFVNLGAAWTNLGLRVNTVVDLGDDTVIGLADAEGHLATGVAAGYGVAHVFGLQNNKIVSFREYTDLDAMIV